MNLTYSIKYYGVDEGQIGILTRKVPFDEGFRMKTQRAPQKLPHLKPEVKFKQIKVE